MSLAILCSGQGPQHRGMFDLTGDDPAAAEIFASATRLLDGRDPRELVRLAPEDLHDNRVGQVLCTTQALAAVAIVPELAAGRRIVAGLSVGEVAAWGVAGLVEPGVTLDLTRRRADAMDAATKPGDGLLFVRGLDRRTVELLCTRHDAAISIVNPGQAYALGGAGRDLDRLAEAARGAGADRVVRIAVEVASHTPRLAEAAVAFRRILGSAVTARAVPTGVRLLSGIDAAPVLDVTRGLDKLAAQIATTIQWEACLAAAVEAGASAFLELGPGHALSEMAAHAHPDIPARSLDDFRSIAGLRSWLARVRH